MRGPFENLRKLIYLCMDISGGNPLKGMGGKDKGRKGYFVQGPDNGASRLPN